MQPRIVDPRSASQRLAQATGAIPANPRNENVNRMDLSDRNLMQSYGSNVDVSGRNFGEHASRNDNDNTEVDKIQNWIFYCCIAYL